MRIRIAGSFLGGFLSFDIDPLSLLSMIWLGNNMENEERYEIREKIGQGGVGAVYRAFDRQLNREVAIKRVLAGGGYENQADATKAMLKEASALCSVQHPNIVTVFDSGVDEDGPFVVMELLSGRTIDEMVERGTLTLQDFNEVALQSQEALVAAQDLDLIHRDIKPTNVMVTWLPSGRFQVKLVDFGLAKFSSKPSLQTIDHGDAVFGSIHFMAPEQFERTELDKRTDLYSMGCVYYFTLAGVYPFDGETAPQVMAAHLKNDVTPIGELRPDLPGWLCDWIMWHLKRNMNDRPPDAREALAKFLMSDNSNTPDPGKPDQSIPARPKLIIPGAQPTPAIPSEEGISEAPARPTAPVSAVPTQPTPQPILPPQGSRPSVHTQAQQLKAPPVEITKAPVQPAEPSQPTLVTPATPPAPPVEQGHAPEAVISPPAPELSAPAVLAAPVVPVTPVAAPVLRVAAAPQPPTSTSAPAPTAEVQTPEQVTVHLQGASPPPAGAAPVPNPLGGAIQATPPVEATSAAVAEVILPVAKKGLSTPVKAVIGVALAVALVIATVMLISGTEKKDRLERLNRLTAPFKESTGQLPSVDVSKKDISILLSELITPSKKAEGERPAYLTALWKADASDGTDVDAYISEFATTQSMNPDVRFKLFEVLARRKGDSAIPALVAFAGRTDEPEEGKAAMEAAGKMANTENFGEILKVVSLAENSAVKSQAVSVLSQVVSESNDPSDFTDDIITAYQSAVDTDTKTRLIRLLGASGGDTAAAIVMKEIEKEEVETTLSAIAAMRQWPDTSMFDTLHGVADGQEDNLLRSQAFTALVDFLRDTKGIEDEDTEFYWTDVANIAVSETEQMKVVDAMARQKSEWAGDILDYFINDAEANATDRVIKRSEQAKRALENRIRRLNKEKK